MARIFRDLSVPLFVTPSNFICIFLSKLVCWNVQAHPSIHNNSKHSGLPVWQAQFWLAALLLTTLGMSTSRIYTGEWVQAANAMTSCQTVGEEGHRHDVHLDNHTQQFTCSDQLLAYLMMHGWITDHISGLGHPGNVTLYRTSLLILSKCQLLSVWTVWYSSHICWASVLTLSFYVVHCYQGQHKQLQSMLSYGCLMEAKSHFLASVPLSSRMVI